MRGGNGNHMAMILFVIVGQFSIGDAAIPLVLNTWNFRQANLEGVGHIITIFKKKHTHKYKQIHFIRISSLE